MTRQENVKATLLSHLQGTHGALSIESLMQIVPPNTPRSTVARALRDLWAHDKVLKDVIPGDPKLRKMWAAVGQPMQLLTPVAGMPGIHQVGTTTGRLSSTGSNTSNAPKALTKDTNKLGSQEVFVDISQAVESVIKNYMAQGNSFSAHDVTTTLRKQVNAGSIKIDSVTDSVRVDGESTQKIEHTEVRQAVHQYYDNGNMPDYTRVDNGTYQEYRPR